MGAAMRSSWPFGAGLVGGASMAARRIGGCSFGGDWRGDRSDGLLWISRTSHGRAGWALAGALVGGPVLGDADAQALCEFDRVGLAEGGVGAFNASQGGGGDFRGGGQLGLCQSFDDTPVSGIALVGGDGDDLLDGGVQHAHDACEEVDLGCAFAALPVEDRGRRDVGDPGEVADADAVALARLGEGLRVESAQHASRHAASMAWRVIARQSHREPPKSANVCVLLFRLSLEYGGGCTRTMRRDSVRLPTLAPRPTPQMPTLAGFEPRFDAVAAPQRMPQPAPPVRPVYWWAKDLRDRGDVLLGIRFDAAQLVAVVTVRLASYRVVEVVRRHDDRPQLPHDVPTLLAEAVWRLGALGWTDELEALVDLLRGAGLIAAPASIRRSTKQIPGWVGQAECAVRIAYWWALVLLRHGWRLHACGDAVARYGFIAEIPTADGAPMLVVYPGDMADDGTEAAALANQLARLRTRQCEFVQRLIADAAAGEGRVI